LKLTFNKGEKLSQSNLAFGDEPAKWSDGSVKSALEMSSR
jgi:hypothetical protein